MKLNRFFALAMIALLVVAAAGVIGSRALVLAQDGLPPAQDCTDQDDDANEAQDDAEDNDAGELECSDQSEAEDRDDQNEAEDGDDQDVAPSGDAAISADVAQQTAEDYLNTGSAHEVELETEAGQLVYSVEIGNQEVAVDAMTGEVLSVALDD